MFQDRTEAGKKLANELLKYKDNKDVIVLAIPRGGVVVAKEIAKFLNLPLDVIIVRKIGAPGNPEFAVGAIDEEGKILENPEVNIPFGYLEEEGKKEKKEIERRIKEYCSKDKRLDIKDKIVILVDDGVATGLTTLKAIDFIKKRKAKKIILAVPVIASDTAEKLKKEVDESVFLEIPEWFMAVGQFYLYFPQIEDREVKEILKNFKR